MTVSPLRLQGCNSQHTLLLKSLHMLFLTSLMCPCIRPSGDCCVYRGFRTYRVPGKYSVQGQFAMLFEMGTLDETKEQSWTWVLGCPIDQVRAAGVEFDPNARGVKSVQGDASSGSALEVRSLDCAVSVVPLCSFYFLRMRFRLLMFEMYTWFSLLSLCKIFCF